MEEHFKTKRRTMILKVIGGVLVIFGIVDLVGSFAGLDVWGEWLRISLPAVVWNFSAYIEIALGYFLFKFGTKTVPIEEESTE